MIFYYCKKYWKVFFVLFFCISFWFIFSFFQLVAKAGFLIKFFLFNLIFIYIYAFVAMLKKKSTLAISDRWNSFLPSTSTFLFQLFMMHHMTKRAIGKSLLPSKKKMSSKLQKNGLCASRRIDFPCIFNEIIASTYVQQDAVKLWRLRTWFMDLILHKGFAINWKLSCVKEPRSYWKPAVCNCVSIPQDKGFAKPIDFCTMYLYKRRCCHMDIKRCGWCELSAVKSDKRLS